MPTKTLFRWFWAWNDEKEENWLREMAQQGWHLERMTFPGNYTFAQGSPRDMVYRLDFFTDTKDKANYLQLFDDAGWEHVGAYGGWQYFRKECRAGETPEIFTDNESKVRKYQRIMLGLIILLPIWITLLRSSRPGEAWLPQALGLVWFFFLLFFIYAILMLIRRIGQLRRRF